MTEGSERASIGASMAPAVGRIDGDRFAPDPSWINSFGVVFGGVTVAVLVEAWANGLEPDETLCSAHLAFTRPLRDGSTTVEVARAGSGRTVSRLTGSMVQDGSPIVDGFAIAARRSGPTTAAPPIDDIPSVDGLEEAIDRARSASFVEEHFEIRVARRPSAADPVVHQWVRSRDLEPARGRLPLAAVGLLADLVGTGVFRTATRELEGLSAVKSLDMSLHLSGATPTEWTLMSISTPPIHEGSAVAHAVLRTAEGAPLATVDQHVLVHPLDR